MPAAARVGDAHVCPMVTGVVPHVGGPIMPPGCPTVLIGGMPAARVGDMATCVGPPDVIAMGSTTVLIGGMPAARMGDPTVHGGVIVMGCPTVMIGIPAPSAESQMPFHVPSNLTISGSPEFKQMIERYLASLAALPTGYQLLHRLEATGMTVIITENTTNEATTTKAYSMNNLLGVLADGFTDAFMIDHNSKAGSVISFDGRLRKEVLADNGAACVPLEVPPNIALGHELIHALHNAEGTQARGKDPLPPLSEPSIDEEEAQAIGVGSHVDDVITENALHREAGLPVRSDHNSWNPV
jgi:uncharacterized Zn-binding protein involved in type VI secretion